MLYLLRGCTGDITVDIAIDINDTVVIIFITTIAFIPGCSICRMRSIHRSGDKWTSAMVWIVSNKDHHYYDSTTRLERGPGVYRWEHGGDFGGAFNVLHAESHENSVGNSNCLITFLMYTFFLCILTLKCGLYY